MNKKVRLSITVDSAMISIINPKNMSEYFNKLLIADVVKQNEQSFAKQLEERILASPALSDFVYNKAMEAIDDVRGDN